MSAEHILRLVTSTVVGLACRGRS